MATGSSMRATLRETYAVTLFTYYQLLEHERIAGIVGRWRDLHCASLAAAAHHNPKQLQDVRDELRAETGWGPTAEEAVGAAEETISAMQGFFVAHPELAGGAPDPAE